MNHKRLTKHKANKYIIFANRFCLSNHFQRRGNHNDMAFFSSSASRNFGNFKSLLSTRALTEAPTEWQVSALQRLPKPRVIHFSRGFLEISLIKNPNGRIYDFFPNSWVIEYVCIAPIIRFMTYVLQVWIFAQQKMQKSHFFFFTFNIAFKMEFTNFEVWRKFIILKILQ